MVQSDPSLRDHIFLKSRLTKIKGRIPYAHRNEDSFLPKLKKSYSNIFEESKRKTKVIEDDLFYFIIKFTDSVGNPIIKHLLDKKLKIQFYSIIDKNAAKVALEKSKYDLFHQILEKVWKYIEDIKEVSIDDKISPEIRDIISTSDNVFIDVGVELNSSLSHEKKELIKEKINEFLVKNQEGKIISKKELGGYFIINAHAKAKIIKEIASQLDSVDSIEKKPEVVLNSFFLNSLNVKSKSISVSLNQMPVSKSSLPKAKDLPPLCILDSGINPLHENLRSALIGTYDYVTESDTPCNDEVDHGTFVAGRAIHPEGDVTRPLITNSFYMVKIFKRKDQLASRDKDIIDMINETVSKFKDKTKVFNLSFSTKGPNPQMTKILDRIAYESDVLFVVSSGNIDSNIIIEELNNGVGYPSYLTKYNIYSPANCFNTITVGSSTTHISTLAPERAPSPFTRVTSSQNRIKPEVLAPGGNVNSITNNGSIVSLDYTNCGVWSYSHDNPLAFKEKAGTSFSAPVVSAIASKIFAKYKNVSANLVKTIIINSCSILSDPSGNPYPPQIQGCGLSREDYALNSRTWRVSLCSEAYFNLNKMQEAHLYKFYVPDKVNRIILTITFFSPSEPSSRVGTCPFTLKYWFHKPGNPRRTKSHLPKNTEFSKEGDNIIHGYYNIKKMGRGVWTLYVKPKLNYPTTTKELKYATVITIVSSGENIYDDVRKKLTQ